MPIMVFECNNCGKEFAKIFLTPENAPKVCPVCGSEGLNELGAAFRPKVSQAQRALCVSCDSCVDTGTRLAAPST